MKTFEHQNVERLDSLNQAVDDARLGYRRALERSKESVRQADTLGAANPDASLIRATAVEQLKTATEKYTAALSALTDAIIHYEPR
jgi:hypothetical protein